MAKLTEEERRDFIAAVERLERASQAFWEVPYEDNLGKRDHARIRELVDDGRQALQVLASFGVE